MQAAQDYASVKAHLEETVANLKRQRDAAQKEVESLGLRVTIRELERQAKSLEGELDALNGKKSLLEQKLASLDAPVAQLAPLSRDRQSNLLSPRDVMRGPQV